jgi:hypothetical protein
MKSNKPLNIVLIMRPTSSVEIASPRWFMDLVPHPAEFRKPVRSRRVLPRQFGAPATWRPGCGRHPLKLRREELRVSGDLRGSIRDKPKGVDGGDRSSVRPPVMENALLVGSDRQRPGAADGGFGGEVENKEGFGIKG